MAYGTVKNSIEEKWQIDDAPFVRIEEQLAMRKVESTFSFENKCTELVYLGSQIIIKWLLED